MNKSGTYHVVKNPDGGWDVKKDGASRKCGHFKTKKNAEYWGKEVSKKEGTLLIIHGKDGGIQRVDSHGNDFAAQKQKIKSEFLRKKRFH